MTGTENNQDQVTQQDPLAPFMAQQAGQPDQPKFVFGQREFNSKEEAEQYAYAEFEKIRQENLQLKGAVSQAQSAPAPPSTQYATGRESENLDYGKWLRDFAEKPDEAFDTLLKYKLLGTTKVQGSAIDMIRGFMVNQQGLAAQVQELALKANYPEVPWNDPRAVQMINQARQRYGTTEGAIAALQRDHMLPTREQWMQHVAPTAQQPQPQQVPAAPPAMGRSAGVSQPVTGGLDVEAVIRKMQDERTTLEESTRLHASLMNYIEQHPEMFNGGQ